MGICLRQLRKQASLTQEQAATLVSVTYKYYQRLEAGRVTGMRLNTVGRIAYAHGLDLLGFFSKKEVRLKKVRAPSAASP
jgi:transcriptional regulator with XRE-family HTH domain